MTKRLVCGMVAHVDAGKTTLSEALLYKAGTLRKLGRVDHGDAFLDTDAQERERGITIFSKQAVLRWKDTEITLTDTPGHTDLAGEMERVLRVLDCAVLVISGADGVQGHTLTLWKLLKRYDVPTLLFVNKMDQTGTDRTVRLEELKRELSVACVDMDDPMAAEEIAMCGEDALTAFLEQSAVPAETVSRLIGSRELFPCYFGSALKNDGIEELLDALSDFGPVRPYGADFGARVYKITRDVQGNRLTWMKITGGILKVRDSVADPHSGIGGAAVREEKINQIRLYSGEKFTSVEAAGAGMVCAVTGLTFTRPGTGLGFEPDAPGAELTPVFTYQVILPQGYDPHTALQKLRLLEEEDPQLQVVWKERTREIHVQLMGEIQLEILSRLLKDRFDLPVRFSEGSILYRETITNTVEGVGHYEPLRHYAETHLLLEPGERGSGIRVSSVCPEDDLERNWQRLILTHVLEKRHLGVLTGSPVTDIRITLLAGRAHLKHTEGGDFRQATYRAIRQGLMQADSVLLEPWYDVRLEIPSDCLGRAMHDLQQMGGEIDPPETAGNTALLTAAVPVARARHYAREVTSYTRGRGKVTMNLRGYEPCKEQDIIVKRFAYDPEADLENTPDSVFCAHGAGFVVRWNHVRDFMHVDTETMKEKKSEDTETRPLRSAGYTGTREEDKELMAIFERTYGSAKPREFRPVVKTAPQEQRTFEPIEQEILLVDGYNVMFAWEELKRAAAWNIDTARTMLMDILCNYRGVRNCELILVFDAYKVPGSAGSTEKYKNITVTYTREAETADSYIEKATLKMSKQTRIRVVSSDGLEQSMILGHGALRVSAKEFRREVMDANDEIRHVMELLSQRRGSNGEMERAFREAWEKKTKT